MNKFLKRCLLILSGIIMIYQPNPGQAKPSVDSVVLITNPIISTLHTLSIHVRDTITHDSIFHFFADKLNLPVYYYPVKYGQCKYAGLFAGNIILEPCGPYSNYDYSTDNFRAIFFGLTYEPYSTLALSAAELSKREIQFKIDATFIYLTDTILCKQNITISIMDKADKIKDRERIDSLKNLMESDSADELGIEYVKEIRIGYTDEPDLQKWKTLIKPAVLENHKLWTGNNLPEIHFIKSRIKEVKGIVFKVKSLEKAKIYLLNNKLPGYIFDKEIKLDKSQTFGLSISFTE
jgi:hypothetical protein